jgi:hypothetical protein
MMMMERDTCTGLDTEKSSIDLRLPLHTQWMTQVYDLVNSISRLAASDLVIG